MHYLYQSKQSSLRENKMEPFIDKVILTNYQIEGVVKQVARKINRLYNGKKDVYLLGVLDGARPFCECLDKSGLLVSENYQFAYIKAKSYGKGFKTSGTVDIDMLGAINIKGRNVLIIDDIYHTGITLQALIKKIGEYEPAEVKTCVLLERDKDMHEVDIKADIVGAQVIDPSFLVGFGLDYQGGHRDLPFIATVRNEK